MDPATVSAAGLSLYQAGGLALLLIGIETAIVYVVGRWLMALITAQGAELKAVRDEMHRTMSTVVGENTKSNEHVVAAIDRMAEIVTQQTDAMRGRPCLTETGEHRRQPTHLPNSALAKMAVLCLAVLMSGCVSERDQAQANSAATIWEAADATERGADPALTMPAIKANAAAIIRSTGSTYLPAGVAP